MRRGVLVAAAALAALTSRGAVADLRDREIHAPVNYFTLVPPPVATSYLDPVFGTAIRRISDARNQPNSADSGNVAFIVNEYSTMSPFSQDNSWILLVHQSYFALYDREGRYVKDLPFDISASAEPRWSRQDPNLLYYVFGNSLKSYDVVTGARTGIRTFAEYSTLGGEGESDLCFDGDHLVLVGDRHDIFVYELSTDRKGPVLDATGHGFDNVSITPGDRVIVTWHQAGGGLRAGIELYDRDMNRLRQLASVGGHMDVGRDTDGQGILLWANAADPQAPADCLNGVVKIRLADGERTCVLSLDWSLGFHVSAPDSGDSFFVSTYAPGGTPPAGWRRYTDELLRVRLDGSDVGRLAHHRSRPFNSYYYMPRATVSRDGSRLVYSSNYALPAVLGYPPYYSDVYLVDVAALTPAYAGSSSPIQVRYEQDHPSVSLTGSWFGLSQPAHSGGSASLSMAAGAQAAFTFAGTAVRWLGHRDEWAGIARVLLDGAPRATVDTFASPSQPQSLLFSARDLGPGTHTLGIEVTGTRNPLSGGIWVWLDAFEAVARREQDAAAVTYTGSWEAEAPGPHSGGSAVRTMNPGARASFRFTGTAVSWIGYRDGGSGIALVLIDDDVRAEIDTYAEAPEAQAVVYTLSGLPDGEHVLTLEATGRRHPLSVGDWIWVDAFETPPE